MHRLLALLFLLIAAPAVAQQQPPGGPSPDDLNRIGNAMIEVAGTQDARILLYAEVSGSDLLYETRYLADGETVVQRAHPQDDTLLQAIAAAWRTAHAAQGDGVWRAMIYQLDHGRVNLRLLYVGDYDPAVSFDDRYAAELGWLSGGNAPAR